MNVHDSAATTLFRGKGARLLCVLLVASFTGTAFAEEEAPRPSAMDFVKRHAGRALLTATLIGTAVGPWTADWNSTHVFNEHWSPHARFHNVTTLIAQSGLALVGLWALWRESDDPWVGRIVAAAIPILAWGAFFPASLVPGAALEDPGHDLPVVLGLKLNLFVAALFMATTVAGFTLDTLFRDPGRRSSPNHALTYW